jgi:lysophospholipase L1-like esterase
MQTFYRFIKNHKTFFISIGFLVVFSISVSYAVPPTSPYTAGQTLDPQCAPGEANCTVSSGVTLNHTHIIYAMGDSLTKAGVYETQLESLVGPQWNVINRGISGDTTVRMATRFSTEVVSSGDAEYVIVFGGVNDFTQLNATAAEIEGRLQSMYDTAHNANIKVIAVTITPWKGNVNWTSGYQAVEDEVNAWILNTATNVDYRIDAYSVLEDPVNPDTLLPAYTTDGLHLTTDGYNLLGTTIYNGATFTPSPAYNNTTLTLSGLRIYANQNLRTSDKPIFAGLTVDTNAIYTSGIYPHNVGISTGTPLSQLSVGGVNANVSIGTTYVNSAAPVNGLIVEGKVGIGTVAPSAALHVVSTAMIATFQRDTNGTGANFVAMYNPNTTDGNTANFVFQANSTGTGAVLAKTFARIGAIYTTHNNATIASSLVFRASNNGVEAEAMRILGNGNVGIGMIVPVYRLDVASGTNNSNWAHLGNLSVAGETTGTTPSIGYNIISNNTAFTYAATDVASWIKFNLGAIDFNTAASGTAGNAITAITAMKIANNGNIGIGTTTPINGKLVIDTNVAAPAIALHITNTASGSGNTAAITFGGAGASAGTYGFIDYNPNSSAGVRFSALGPLVFGSNSNAGYATSTFTEAMRITNVGRVGIANAAPAVIFHVGSASVVTGTTVARFQNAGGTCDIVPSTSGGITCTSDMTLKKNISLLANGSDWSYSTSVSSENQSVLSKILELTPVRYNWLIENDGDSKHAGFIAQEVRQIFPDLVSEDPASHLLSLNYAGMMPYTIQAIKEMNVTMKALPTFADPTIAQKIADFLTGIAERGEAVVNKVTTNELCLNSTCLTENELQSLIQLQKKMEQNTDDQPDAPAALPPAEPKKKILTDTPPADIEKIVPAEPEGTSDASAEPAAKEETVNE